MYKELVICIIIIVVIFSFDFLLQNYTDNAVKDINSNFEKIKSNINKQGFDKEKLIQDSDQLYLKWEEYNDKFSYFIEHTELEKVETEFISFKSYLKSKQYHDALAQIDRTTFVLNHINEKYSFSLKNIF